MNDLRHLIEDLESARKEEDGGAENITPAAEGEPAAVEHADQPVAPTAPGEQGTTPRPADPAQREPLPDLRELIGEKQRQRFVRRVFNRDQAYFSGVIATLNSFRSWDEAAAYLKKVYAINRLDPFNESVVEFTDLVQRRFSNEMDAPR